MSERNMYGVLPCPMCGSKFRWFSVAGVIVCDDCGRVREAIEVQEGGRMVVNETPVEAGRCVQ